MKIRDGFVSNSSSTSFCIVGVSGSIVKELFRRVFLKSGLKVENAYDAFGYGVATFTEPVIGDVWFVGRPNTWDLSTIDEFVEDAELDYAGFEAKELLEDNSLVEARKVVAKHFSFLGVTVPEKSINLHYGESSSE